MGTDGTGNRPPRLVLIEDNPGDAVLVREMLRASWEGEFAFEHFDRLSAARERLLVAPATCILLDLSLPDAQGLEAVDRVQSVVPDVPIVVLSGLDDEELALRAVQGGAQDYLIKGRVDDHLVSRSVRYAIERKRAEVALAHQALHDSLTGLPNRALFLDRLKLALARSARRSSAVAVLFLDLDRFKLINDSSGHEAGDRVLVDVGARLERALRPGDTVARFGGDEFTALCEDMPTERAVLAIAERMAQAVAMPFLLGDSETFLSASIGIAMADGDAHDEGLAESLVRDADAAMYRAKERGKSRVELFDAHLRERAVRRLSIEGALHRALERDELRLHYQPQIDLPSGRIVGWEALVRWEHPERGLLQPSDFVQVAEETGLILALGSWVLDEACRQAARWSSLDGALPDPAMAVNLSPRQLSQPELVDVVAHALELAGLPPSRLCLEMTESVVVDHHGGAAAMLDALRELGVQLALDDFGSGYSALSSLKRYRVDVLKVDQGFVAELGRDAAGGPILAAIIDLTHALGLRAVAEGVERAEQLALLRTLGCDMAQGFYFGRPQPPEAAEATALSTPRY
ncbi:MAG TPA: EAL domain-containing protein [Solirubrobacteraceae bacterium]|nr:EAL domain-containing protein [Solirubrobacteraceae bacterium]